jgi:hypothetical protein
MKGREAQYPRLTAAARYTVITAARARRTTVSTGRVRPA